MTLLPSNLQRRLTCPRCRSHLLSSLSGLACSGCHTCFPIVDGVPILLAAGTLFSPLSGKRPDNFVFFRDGIGRADSFVRRRLPASGTNLFAKSAFLTIEHELGTERTGRLSILILGSGDGGASITTLLAMPDTDFVHSDVVLRSGTSVVLDAHHIPFESGTFDVVVAQAVLEHVLDPVRCVEEIWRVLRTRGLVYAETPFMQQVHGGRYDFTRYTFLGHRRLFRRFEEVSSGIVAGPGTSLAWAWEYFLMSFCRSARTRLAARLVGRLSSFHLKYFDPFLSRRPGSYDAASALGFVGRKAGPEKHLDDERLIELYPGMAE